MRNVRLNNVPVHHTDKTEQLLLFAFLLSRLFLKSMQQMTMSQNGKVTKWIRESEKSFGKS
jgi:hypothetical protein